MTAKVVPNFIYSNNLIDLFPNTAVSVRIYSSLLITVASAKRNFPKLKILKHFFMIIIEQLLNFSIIGIENEELE